MAIVKPFRAWRPRKDLAAQVAALPYDVMNREEAAQMAKNNPFSFLHVSRAEIDLPEEIDIHSEEVYEQANINFKKMIADGVLVQDETPGYSIYAQTMQGRKQYGLVGCSAIEDYFSGVIKKHEFTRPEKEADRIHHMKKIEAHVGPIFLTFPDHSGLENIIRTQTQNHLPEVDFTAEDGVGHSVWVIRDPSANREIERIFTEEIPCTYIADGHHRTASAAKVGKALQQENPNHTGNEEYNFFLSVLFPASHLAIMDYNRVVTDLNGLSAEDFLAETEKRFVVEKSDSIYRPDALHRLAMYINNQWYRLTVRENFISNDPIGMLDVTILQEALLSPVLGITDPRTDKRIDFVGGIRGLEALSRRVDSGEMQVAFALYPVSLNQLMRIADSGEVMPPKSTWFEPKLRDGLFIHTF